MLHIISMQVTHQQHPNNCTSCLSDTFQEVWECDQTLSLNKLSWNVNCQFAACFFTEMQPIGTHAICPGGWKVCILCKEIARRQETQEGTRRQWYFEGWRYWVFLHSGKCPRPTNLDTGAAFWKWNYGLNDDDVGDKQGEDMRNVVFGKAKKITPSRPPLYLGSLNYSETFVLHPICNMFVHCILILLVCRTITHNKWSFYFFAHTTVPVCKNIMPPIEQDSKC